MTASLQPTKRATVVVLDVSRACTKLSLCKDICQQFIQGIFIESPSDMAAVVLGGTNGSANRLNGADGSLYRHLSVVCPMSVPTATFIKAIDGVTNEDGNFDFLDALIVAADILQDTIGTKKYQKRILFVSVCSGTVQRKTELDTIANGLKANKVSLLFAGVDFEEDPADVTDWSTLTVKEQNERVVHFICQQLEDDGTSAVVPVADVAEAFQRLKKKYVAQRPLAKVVWEIGDIKIAVNLFTRCAIMKPASGKRVTAKGEPVVVERKYYSITEKDKEIEASERIRAFRYGRSPVPFTDMDVEQMKLKNDRSLKTLAFIPRDHVKLHLLQGGVKVVASIDGDTQGAQGLAAFITAMSIRRVVAIVRFVARTNADPSLGMLFPGQSDENKVQPDVLHLVNIPFEEDFRGYTFPSYNDVSISVNESRAVSDMFDTMQLGKNELLPENTFNPYLQYLYSCTLERYLRAEAPLPPIPNAVARSSTGWEHPGHDLQPLFSASSGTRKRVRELFPVPADGEGGKKANKPFWFVDDPVTNLASYQSADKLPRSEGGVDNERLMNVGAPLLLTPFVTPGVPRSDVSGTPTTMATFPTPQSGDPTELDSKVTTVDPAGTFLTITSRTDEDNIEKACYELQEVIFYLIRRSIGSAYYDRCAAGIAAMRVVCVREGEPQLFNSFLTTMGHVTQDGGAHETFWQQYVVTAGVLPISNAECAESDLSEAAAKNFHTTLFDKAPKLLVEEKDGEDDLFGELE